MRPLQIDQSSDQTRDKDAVQLTRELAQKFREDTFEEAALEDQT